MRLVDADMLFKDICDSIEEMTKIRIGVDGEWLWAKLNDALENAPTIDPERKRGHWLDDPDGYKCSECGAYFEIDCGDAKMNFCPNCGLKMEANNEID